MIKVNDLVKITIGRQEHIGKVIRYVGSLFYLETLQGDIVGFDLMSYAKYAEIKVIKNG